MTVWQRWQQTALHNKALVWTGIMVAFGTLFYAGAAVFQICMMKESARQSSAQADALIAKADSIAKSMGAANAQQKTALDETLLQNREALAKTLSQGKAVLDASIDISRNDQRAWLNPVSFRLTVLTDNSPLTAEVTIANVGKTPAFNIRYWGRIQTSYSRLSVDDCMKSIVASTPGRNVPAIFPAPALPDPYFVPFSTDQALTPTQVKEVQDHVLLVYVFGDIHYEDSFRRPHFTQFCGIYVPLTTRFETCREHEGAN
jgi:flagellar basal body-associated protein FliL